MNAQLRRSAPQLATLTVVIALYLTAGFFYPGFFAPQVALNLFTDNAALGITAVGLTLVIFSGGIDLSVGAVAGFASIFAVTLVQRYQLHPATAALCALAVGGAYGGAVGYVIHAFQQPPFLITLAGMFLARGGAFWITTESVGISHPAFDRLSSFELPVGGGLGLTSPMIALVIILLAGCTLAQTTRFGRTLIALGGNANSALLMGLPVARTRILAYVVSSLCATMAGLVLVLYTGSGNPSFGIGLELDAIAVVVIGGTLLTGGRGHMAGTVLGLLVFGLIQTALTFDGRLSAHWSRIIVGALLLVFILAQRFLQRRLG